MDLRSHLVGASATPPAAPSSPSVGFPSAGTPGIAPATEPGPYWFHQIAEELRAIQVAAGQTPSQGTLNQLLTALRALFLGNAQNVAIVDAGGVSRFVFNAASTTDFYGTGATPFQWRNAAAAVLASLAGTGVLSTAADAVASNDVPRFGQLNSRPGHTYTDNDWAWFDKGQGIFVVWGTFPIGDFSGSSAGTVTFNQPFTTACFHVQMTPGFNTDAVNYALSASKAPTTTGVAWNVQEFNSNSTPGSVGFYFAIGK